MNSLLKSLVLAGCVSAFAACSASPVEDDVAQDEGALSQPGVSASTAYEVQLEAALAPADMQAKLASLGTVLEVEERTVTFYDTPDLALFRAGTILRSKAASTGGASIEVKRSPLSLGEVEPARIAATPGGDFEYKVDVDLGPTGGPSEGKSSCQLKRTVAGAFAAPKAAADIGGLFNDDQKLLVKGGIPAGVVALGPIKSKIWKFAGDPVAKKVKIEQWEMPDGAKVLEASADLKVTGPVAGSQAMINQRSDALRTWLAERKLTVTARPAKSKTQSALEALAARPR